MRLGDSYLPGQDDYRASLPVCSALTFPDSRIPDPLSLSRRALNPLSVYTHVDKQRSGGESIRQELGKQTQTYDSDVLVVCVLYVVFEPNETKYVFTYIIYIFYYKNSTFKEEKDLQLSVECCFRPDFDISQSCYR